MSFLKSLAQFFGFRPQQPTGQWLRKVESWELPPECQPILLRHLRQPLPPGIREVTGADHQGWQPWKARQQEPQRQHPIRHPDMQRMRDYLVDGAAPPPDKKD
jgi:hypothetical protein